LSGRKVLLVDDEKDFVEALGERMRHRGLDVATAVSGKEAVQMAQGETYDVIVLDLEMPEIDGLETLTMLKEENANTHFILLTGYATADKGIRAMLSGAEEVLEKPSNVGTLIRKIEKLVSRKIVKV
jgi:two-component system OmpR family response regulator